MEHEKMLSGVEQKIDAYRKERREEASLTFQTIGRTNREISNHRSQLGLMRTQQVQLFGEIGRHISRHCQQHPLMAEIYRQHQSLIDIMTALRNSILRNRKLSSSY